MRNSSYFQKFIGVFLTLVFISPDALALTNTILNPVTFEQKSDSKWDSYLESLPMGWKDDHTAYLGVSSNDALGKPSDDVFEFYISEAELAAGSFELSFSVSGVNDADATPLVINGQSSYGNVTQQAKQGWQRGSMTIMSDQLVAGRNTVLFTLPEGVNHVSVKQVSLTPKTGIAIPTSPMVLTEAISQDFNAVLSSGYYANLGNKEAPALAKLPSYALSKSQVASIPASFTNLTRGAVAYRVLGQRDSITHVTIGVDPSVGYNRLREVKVFYFDYDKKEWAQAHVSKVNHVSYTLEADGEGGTDYFAAMIKTPDMPEAGAFMPTSISDLEPANPATGINLIQPPTANQQGDANISYPISIPPGRQGMQPQVSLNYSSSGGSSWAGYGWSVPVQSISVDTRFGVPTFNSTTQTEVYLFNGESLHEEDGKKANRPTISGSTVTYPSRDAGRQYFFTKQMSAYRTIERKKANPKSYYWIVTEADGSKSYFGAINDTTGDNNSVLKTPSGHITKWFLKKRIDRFGNNIIYTYSHETDFSSGLKSGGITVQLEKIEYTGSNDSPGRFSVEFITTDNRPDARIMLNSGAKEVDDRQLAEIKVKYDTTLIKQYKLQYTTGDFGKELLASIGEYRGDTLFYKHEFTYNQVGSISFGASPDTISFGDLGIPLNLSDMQWQKIRNKVPALLLPSLLKTTKSKGWTVGGAAGVGASIYPIDANPDKVFTLSGKLSYSESRSYDSYSFQDVNGDGLPDLVFTYPSSPISYYKPLSIVNGELKLGATRRILGNSLYSNDSYSINSGVDFVLPLSVFAWGRNWNRSVNTVNNYLIDYNKDGVLDRVVPTNSGHTILFGILGNDGNLHFEPNSANTLNPVLKDQSLSVYSGGPQKPFEVVKTWIAPVAGNINVVSSPSLVAGMTGDAIVSIQKNSAFIQAPTSIGSSYYNNTIAITKGDTLCFRLSPNTTGHEDFFIWNPSINYTTSVADDGNGTGYSSSSYSSSFVLSGLEGASFAGDDQLRVSLNRSINGSGFGFSDDIYFRITVAAQDVSGNTSKHFFINRLDKNATSFTSFSEPFIGNNYATIPGVAPDDTCTVTFELFSHSNVDWSKISFRPKVEIKTDCIDEPIEIYPNVGYYIYNHVDQLQGSTGFSTPSGYHEISPVISQNNSDISAVFNNISGEDIDQIVYFSVKSGGKFISKKAIVLHLDANGQSSNTLSLRTLSQSTGAIWNTVSASQYSGAATATFLDTEVSGNEIYLEFFAEESPFASAALNYIKNNLQRYNVINSLGIALTPIGSTSPSNYFYRNEGPLRTQAKCWGQFGWSGDMQSPIPTREMEVPGTDMAFGQSAPYDENTIPKQQAEGLNPWDNAFSTLSPVRGENSVGLREYLENDLTTDSKKDHWAIFGSYIGNYRENGKSVPGIFGEPSLPTNVTATTSSVYSAFGASRVNESFTLNENISQNTGPGTFAFGQSQSNSVQNDSKYYGWLASGFQDLNGDGYPDRIVESGNNVNVQFTNSSGGHRSAQTLLSNDLFSKNTSISAGLMVNGSYSNEDVATAKVKGSVSANGSLNYGNSYEAIEYVDVNGDGLVDRVSYQGGKTIAFNNGEGFDSPISWTIPFNTINASEFSTKSIGASAASKFKQLNKGKTKLAFSFSAGIGINNAGSNSSRSGIDLNGDGLNDVVVTNGSNTYVYLNTGTGFALHQDQSSAVNLGLTEKPNQRQGVGFNRNIGATVGIPLGAFVKLSLSANGGDNFSVNKQRSSFLDVNGDGAVDFVTAEENGDLLVYYSNVQKSNLLTNVSNPLGGSFDIDYALEGRKSGVRDAQVLTHRSGEKVVWDMPQAKWVLNKVTINDGLDIVADKGDNPDVDLDGADSIVIFFSYDGGIQNRREKAFSGFTRVETKQQNQITTGERFLTEVVEYYSPDEISFEALRNHDYVKSLVRNSYALLHENTGSGLTVKLISQQNSSYEFRMVDIASSSINSGTIGQVKKSGGNWVLVDWNTINESSTIFPAVTETEAMTIPQLASSTRYHSQEFEIKYDEFFNVTEYRDKADMVPGTISEVTVDTIYSVKILSYEQQNTCLDDLPSSPVLTAPGLKAYEIAANITGYSVDTLWLIDLSGNCSPSDIYGLNLCDNPDDGTFVTHHYKEVPETTYVSKTISGASYSSDRIALMTYFNKGDADQRTNVLETHKIYVGTTQPADLVRSTTVSALTSDKKSIATISTKLNASDYAVTDIKYDGYGNVIRITGAENAIGQRAYTDYTYDSDVHQYVESVTNQFGEGVCNTYAKPTWQLSQTIGVGGQALAYEYDEFDRLKNVWAPREINIAGSAPTVSYSYDLSGTIAKATTTHNLANSSNTTINNTPRTCAVIDLSQRPSITSGVRTVTFVDGTAKAVQIHTEQSKMLGSLNTNSFAISGVLTIDKFGRAVQQYADIISPPTGNNFGTFYVHDDYVEDDLVQKNVSYDYNNRLLSQDIWTGENGTSSGQWTTTEMEYGWNTDLGGSEYVYFEKTWKKSSLGSGTTTPDFESAVYTDSRGRKVGQIGYGATSSDDITTKFSYNPIGELINVTDPIGLVTTYSYDLAGRVLTENHPDRGLTETFYDKAGNVTFFQTPGTLPFGGGITFSYNYNRLVSKRMPGSNGTDLYDINYLYGTSGNEKGRLIQVDQGAGFKVDMYQYDELGNRVTENVTMQVPIHGTRDFVTTKAFDSFGRIIQTVYPDGDTVDYSYTALGELYTITSTVGGLTEDIVSKTLYNGAGQISKLVYGNGTETEYTYISSNNSASLKSGTLYRAKVYGKEQSSSTNTTLLDRNYTYNTQGMVAKLERDVAGSLVGGTSGTLQSFTDTYTYDRFGRFTQNVHKQGASTKYVLDMTYNKAGGITQKNVSVSNVTNGASLNYNLNYSYSKSNPHQIDNIVDQVTSGQSQYTFNSSGSIQEIQDPLVGGDQKFFWNEEQWLSGVSNDLGVHHYVYDYNGERILKSSVMRSAVQVNDQNIDEVQYLEPYSIYVNPFYVVTDLLNGDKVSKHYFMNTQRVATDISISYTDPNPSPSARSKNSESNPSSAKPSRDPASSNYNSAFADLQETLEEFGQKPLDLSQTSERPTLESYFPELTRTSSNGISSKNAIESSSRILFWYHPDYLGNVDLITDRDGVAHEFILYNPWGEEMHQWNANTFGFSSPYRFNSKELDQETGLHYYGARYYQSKLSSWMSVDPLAHKTLEPYSFAGNNPIVYVDPTGLSKEEPSEDTNPPSDGMICIPLGDDTFTPALGKDQINEVQVGPGAYKESRRNALDRFQTALDVVGLIPGLGEIADGINAIIYFSRGDKINGLLSLAAMAPIGGQAATAAKFGRKALKYSDEAVGTTKGIRKYWNKSSDFRGTKVYQRDDLINPKMVDAGGRTNLDRMKKGLAPIGPDGKSINLHHTLQSEAGPLAEMTGTFHTTNSSVIHINPKSIPSGINRSSFNTFRSNYWKNRANDF